MKNGLYPEAIMIKVLPYTGPDGLFYQREYRGRVAIYENGIRIYSVFSPVRRIFRADALDDAVKMKSGELWPI